MIGAVITAVVIAQAQVQAKIPTIGWNPKPQLSGGRGILPKSSPQDLVGYLPYYRTSSFNYSNLRMCTDVIYFAGEFTVDADLVLSSSRRSDLAELAQLSDFMGYRVFLSIIGDFGTDGFEEAVSTEAGRVKMANELAVIVYEYGLDGIDFDWEFPDNWTEVGYYTDLLWKTKTAINDIDGMITVAVAPGQLMNAAFFEPIDRVHMMSYLTTFTTCQTYSSWILNKGCPPSKLAIGLPFYGRDQVTNSAYRYSTLVGMYPVLDQDPFIDNVDNIFLNGRYTQYLKTTWAKDAGFRGVAIWELGQDINGRTSLLRNIWNTQNRG